MKSVGTTAKNDDVCSGLNEGLALRLCKNHEKSLRNGLKCLCAGVILTRLTVSKCPKTAMEAGEFRPDEIEPKRDGVSRKMSVLGNRGI